MKKEIEISHLQYEIQKIRLNSELSADIIKWASHIYISLHNIRTSKNKKKIIAEIESAKDFIESYKLNNK